MVFFTSDLHLGHRNIIQLCNRPFSSIDEMDQRFIEKWNEKVTDADTVYILGDLMFRNGKPPEVLESDGNGQIVSEENGQS